MAQEAQLHAIWWPGRVEWESGWEAQEGGPICIPMANSQCCTVKTKKKHCKAIIFQYLKKGKCMNK